MTRGNHGDEMPGCGAGLIASIESKEAMLVTQPNAISGVSPFLNTWLGPAGEESQAPLEIKAIFHAMKDQA